MAKLLFKKNRTNVILAMGMPTAGLETISRHTSPAMIPINYHLVIHHVRHHLHGQDNTRVMHGLRQTETGFPRFVRQILGRAAEIARVPVENNPGSTNGQTEFIPV
ncbi:MAG: hypothetical protein ABSF60_11340 [Verrucomicrobiota bacterium]